MTKNSINNIASDLQVSAINLSGSTISTTTTDTDLILSPSGSGNVSVTASSIIPTTDRIDNLGNTTNSWNNIYANSLSFDDGTNSLTSYIGQSSYTPSISFGGGTTGITYLLREGEYFKINNLIFFSFAVRLTSKGSSTGNLEITLPFSSVTSFNNALFTIRFENTVLAANTFVYIDMVNIGSSRAVIRFCSPSGISTVTNTSCTNTSTFFGSAFYYI
jgi:hypothetical protein